MAAVDGPTIVLLAPMLMELEAVLATTPGWQVDTTAPRPLHRSTLTRDDGSSVRLVAALVGMGTAPAEAATGAVLDHEPVDHVVVLGIAGGVLADASIGDLVVAEQVVHGPSGRTHRAATLGPLRQAGTLHTSDELVQDADALRALVTAGVVALDMETAAVAQVCEARGVPWSSVRAISDLPGDGGISEEVAALTGPDGLPDLEAVTRYLAEDPSRAEVLERLGRDATHAAQVAADAAIAAIQHVVEG